MKRTIRPVRNAMVVFSLLLKVICPLWSQAIVKDLKFQEIPLSTVLDRLSIASKMRFFYDEHKLRSEIVSITIKEREIDGILNDLLKGLNYSFVYYDDRSIVIVPKDILGEGISSSKKSKTAGSIDYNREVNPIVVGDEGTVTPGKALVSGLIIDSLTSQELIGASITFTNIEGPGIVTNTDGHFEFEVTPGDYEAIVEYLGYEPKELLLKVEGNGFISLLLNKSSIDLEEVVINEKADRTNVNEVQIGVLDIDLKEIRQLPAFLGEYDIIKTLIATPGVSSVGEGASGFNVRGGAVDQNLILLNNCDIYNASHALGFFSTFNSDIAKSVSLYKGNIPAKYGGRISSVMDVKYREGNYDRFAMKAGLGPAVSRIMVEGPIIKDKLTFIAGTRFSFVDWILDLTTIQELQKSSANFNDNYFSLSYKPNLLDRIIFSHYSSQDQFSYNREFGFDYDTKISQISYQKLLNSKVSSHTSFSSSRYVSSRKDYLGSDAAKLGNEVSNKRFGQSILWSISHDLALDLGINAVFIEVDPGKVSPLTEASLVAEDELATERASEISLYFSGDCNASNRLALIGGVRFTQYDFYGPADIYQYHGSPSIESVTGMQRFGSRKSIISYHSIEPRVSFRYKTSAISSIKGGYSKTSQFINQLFNSDSPTPISQWQLSKPNLRPLKGDTYSLGYFQTSTSDIWEFSTEVYFRKVHHLYDYKDFASLILNRQIETEILYGKGRAYGIEWSVKKKEGIVHGSLSYHLSRTERLISGINKGNWYPSNFDKPHDLSILVNYQPNRRNTLSFNFVYASGRPTTTPGGNFQLENGLVVPVYYSRNQDRIPDYHRIDVSYTIGRSYKRNQKVRTSWTISVYNIYGRRNAFSVFYTTAAFRQIEGKKLSILGNAFPSITFNIDI